MGARLVKWKIYMYGLWSKGNGDIMSIIDTLKDIVQINSVFTKEYTIGEYLFNALGKSGFNVKKQYVDAENKRFNVTGVYRPNGKIKHIIGFYGHMDTVPVQGKWDTNPFELTINFRGQKNEKNIGKGLGVYDMKSGVAAILETIKSKPKDVELRVAFGVDEENNSLGGYTLLNSQFFSGCNLVIVPEINDSDINKEGTILLGRRGRVRYVIAVHGQSGHGAGKNGVNAIYLASQIIQLIEKMSSNESEHMKGSQYVNYIHSEVHSLSIPDLCEINLDVHLADRETEMSVLNRIKLYIHERLPKVKFDIFVKQRDVPYLMPYWTDKMNPYVQKLGNIVNSVIGNVQYFYGLSVADECIIAKMAPVISLGPIGGNEHRQNEWVDLDSVKRLVDIFDKFIHGPGEI